MISVNFAFLALKTMRFYGWSWEELMRTPITGFWTCNKYIERLRADEAIHSLDSGVYAQADEKGRKEIFDSLQKRIGTVTVESQSFDEDGWNTLRNLSQ